MTQHFQTAETLFDDWRDDVVSGQPPEVFLVGCGTLEEIEIGPGLVMLIGGAPGAGKTAFVMQTVIDALRLTPSLRSLVCNVEMPPSVLLDRQLARLSGVDARTIRKRELTEKHSQRIEQGLAEIESIADRLAFAQPPFDLETVALAADEFQPQLIVLDYIQRIAPPEKTSDKRTSVNHTMDYLRQFADTGIGLIVVSAVGRTKNKQGNSSYDASGMSLASFRETSELEFGCDNAYLLTPNGDDEKVDLRHLKSRHGECQDISLWFDKNLQRFDPVEQNQVDEKLQQQVMAVWQNAQANDEG